MFIDSKEYGSFYGRYINLTNGIPLQDLWKGGLNGVLMLMNNLTDEESLVRYEPEKWSLKEVFGHMLDTERIFCYRALAVARGEEEIIGYDHNIYLNNADFDRASLRSLKEQYIISRKYTESLFGSFSDKDLLKTGIVNSSTLSVRAMAYVIAGHEQHHLHIIAEKYLPIITLDAS